MKTPDNIKACELLAADGRVLMHATEGEFTGPAGAAWVADVAAVRWIDGAGETVALVPATLRPAPVAGS